MRVITAAVVMLLVRAASVDAAPTLQLEKSPAPSRVFGTVRAGMALAEAKQALAAFDWDASYRDAAARRRLVMPTADGAKYYVLVTGETVARIGIEAPERGLEAKLTRLWGAPTHAKNPANETLTSWARSTSPWRVDMACRNTLCRLAFHERLTPAFFGTAIAPPGALAALVPGMTREQVAAVAPLHAGGADVPAGFEDVHVKVDIASSTGTLRSVVIVGLPLDARDLLTKAWGPPTDSDRGPQWIGDRGWRAFYDPELRAIELVSHVTVAQLLGAGPGIAALVRPILGAHHDQIAAAYPSFTKTRAGGTLALPPIEGATTPTTLALRFNQARRATSLTMALPYASATARIALAKLLASKWGTPSVRPGNVLAFPTGKVRIEARDTGRAFELSIAIQ